MPAFIVPGSNREPVALVGDRLVVGSAADSDVVVVDDHAVSRRHAVLDRYGTGWSIRDVGSRNGTFLNGERLTGERMLRPGDVVRLGRTEFVFRSDDPVSLTTITEESDELPPLTRRERDVLIALCRPIVSNDPFTDPATVRAIAAELVVTDAAVKQHLQRLYAKFGVAESGERRRVRLANEAVKRGAVTIDDVRRR